METTQQVEGEKKLPPNPTGKGGFGDNPQNISPGGWRKEDSISYQYNKFMRMSVTDVHKWEIDNPEDTRTMAQEIAYRAMVRARNSLRDLQEITDRTEGKAQQIMRVEGSVEMGAKEVASALQKIIEDDDTEKNKQPEPKDTDTEKIESNQDSSQ